MPTTAQISKKALDALSVSQEVFIFVAKSLLESVNKSEMAEVPFLLGHTKETSRVTGTLYVIPNGKRRVAFPLFWDTEPKKYLYPDLFQALQGPGWKSIFNAETESGNGTIHLDTDLTSESVTDLPDMIDSYLKERLPESGLIVLYRPLFSSVDRYRMLTVDGDADQAVTKFVQELYGFFPEAGVPLAMVTKATEGVPDGYGVEAPAVKTAAAPPPDPIETLRYVAADNLKDAKSKTRLYTSYNTACDFAQNPDQSIFRVKVEDGVPNWGSAREVHSVMDEMASKTAAIDWLGDVERLETRRLISKFKSVLGKN